MSETTDVSCPATPALDKAKEVHDESQAIGEFIDWLRQVKGLHLMRWGDIPTERPCSTCNGMLASPDRAGMIRNPDGSNTWVACPHCEGTGHVEGTREDWVMDTRSIEAILGEYYEIDPDQMERERMALLEWLRREIA